VLSSELLGKKECDKEYDQNLTVSNVMFVVFRYFKVIELVLNFMKIIHFSE